MSGLLAEQPSPVAAESDDADNPAVWPRVIAQTAKPELIVDMVERDALGRRRYGTPLTVWNGRDALADAYQEVLDAVVYLEQCRMRLPPSSKLWDPYSPADQLLVLRRECEGMLSQLRRLQGKVPVERPR